MDQPRIETFREHGVESGRYESSPDEFNEQVEAVYRLIGRYLGTTLEEFRIAFTCDRRFVDEVAIWCRVASAWYEYHDAYLGGERLSDDQEEKLVAALIAISAGQKEMQHLPVTTEVGARLLACYTKEKMA